MMDSPERQKYIHDRLERIELKMDRLVEAVTQMARLEERIGSSIAQNRRQEDAMHLIEKRVNILETKASASQVHTSIIERIVYQALGLLAAAAVGAGAVYLRTGAMM